MRKERVLDRALWIIKQGMCERAKAVWEKIQMLLHTLFLGQTMSWCNLSWLFNLQTAIFFPMRHASSLYLFSLFLFFIDYISSPVCLKSASCHSCQSYLCVWMQGRVLHSQAWKWEHFQNQNTFSCYIPAFFAIDNAICLTSASPAVN